MIWHRNNAVEDPERIVRFTEAVSNLDWRPASHRSSLDVVFRQVSDLVQAEIRYYYGCRRSSRRLSKFCRLLSWLLGSIGILFPLVHGVLDKSAPENLLAWGYIAFGVAGAVLVADSVFAGSEAHQRYTATQLELEKLYTLFAVDWQASLVRLSANLSPELVLDQIGSATLFVSEMHRAMGAETSAWQVAMNKALGDLKGKISAKDQTAT